MPILLVSSGGYMTEHVEEITGMIFKDKKIGHVITASVVAKDKGYIQYRQKRMTELGWNFDEIDIMDKSEDELRNFFKDKDIVYVEGGSTFYLLKAIKQGKFEKIVREMLDQGKLYIGSSAGAYVACPNINVAVWINKRHNWSHEGLTEFSAMNLVPYLIRVHYTPEDDKALTEARKKTDLDIKTISDEEYIYIK